MLIDECVNIIKNDTDYFTEASTEQLKTDLLDIDKFIKVNRFEYISFVGCI